MVEMGRFHNRASSSDLDVHRVKLFSENPLQFGKMGPLNINFDILQEISPGKPLDKNRMELAYHKIPLHDFPTISRIN